MNSNFKPNRAFFKFLKDEYSKAKYKYAGVSVSDEVLSLLLNTSYGWTAWFKSKDGAKSLFRIVGIRDMPPHDGFTYYYIPPHGERQRIDTSHGLRIYQSVTPELVEASVAAIDIAKRVVYTEGWKLPTEEVFRFVYNAYRTWLRTQHGIEWCKSSFKPILHTKALDGLVYKATSVSGETHWLGKTHVKPEANAMETCEACDYEFPCTDSYTGLGVLCNRCYAENFADGTVLQNCSRFECEELGCHNYLDERTFHEAKYSIDKLPIKWTAQQG